jgi:NACHT domain
MNGQEALAIIDRILIQNHQRKLKDIQSAVVLQIWDGHSYPTIGKALGYEPDYIKQVAAHLWQTLSKIAQERVSKSNIRSILQRYQISPTHTDWGEAIDVSNFYDRTTELQTLHNWIINSHCRTVGIFGWSGSGKTALSVKLAQQLTPHFEYVLWRSLRQAPPLNCLLDQILPFLNNSATPDNSISMLMQQLRQKRCLLIIDNIESILQPGDCSGLYIAGYEAYGNLLERISDESHQSCLIVTGREKPQGMTRRESNSSPVKSLRITGLSMPAAQGILHDQGISALLADQQKLINHVNGNPLALKLLAITIQNLFSGNVPEFLAQKTFVFSSLRHLLDQQFDRLSALQQQIMCELATNSMGIMPNRLQAALTPAVALPKLLEALEILHDRALIETTDQGLTQQPIIREYIIQKFTQHITDSIVADKLPPVKSPAYLGQHTFDRSPLLLVTCAEQDPSKPSIAYGSSVNNKNMRKTFVDYGKNLDQA